MECSYYALLKRMMILACRRNQNFASNPHALAIQIINADLQLNRGNVLDRCMDMSYWACIIEVIYY